MTSNNMEMNENDKYKSPDNECLWTTDSEASAGKKFTIPKIRRTTEKVYLSSCLTNTREYGLIHGTLKQCRLDASCDLQFTWQFGDTKLVRNEYLEKQFAAKRSEMREGGRHSRELEEHFCFLALPQIDVVDVYQNGLSVNTSAPRILGNPLLGVYLFRHVDVALRHALSRSMAVESIMVFKVLFGRVKKIQPSIDKNKVSLDPSPNFDCHMSRNMPSLKETIELQTYNSMVYFYEYDFFSRPVDKPRQCLPYAIVTVKCIGQKAGNGQLMTSLRFPSTGFPKRLERACSLNNCTIAKRIGKGKDATVIFEHFRKPVDPFVQENCPCKALNSEMGPSISDTSNSYGNVQNGNNSVLEAFNRRTENSSKLRDASQVYAHNSGFSFIPTDNTASGNGDLFSVTYLRSILSSISAAFPSHSNTGSSTVITSKLIKDPRLMKREQSMRNQNNTAGLSDILSFEKSLGHDDSQIKLTCIPTSPISSSEVPADHTSCLDASCFKFSSESSHYQAHNMGLKGYDCIASGRIAVTEQFKEQHSSSLPNSLSNAFSDVGKQKDSEEQVKRVQIRSIVPVSTAQSSEPQNSYESENNCSNDSQRHFSQESLSSDINTIYKVGHQMSTVFPVQKKGNLCEYMQDMGMMRTFISPEDSSKDGVNQTWCKETVFTNETIGNSNTLYQELKEGGNSNSLSGNCEKIAVTHKLQMPKIPMSSTEDKNELDREASELECYLTPNIECLTQKFPQHSLEHKDNTNFAMTQGLIELKTVQNNQNFSNILSDAFQEAKDVPLASEKLIDRVISSSAIDIPLDSSVCNIIGEYTCVQRENENGAVSPYNCHKEEAALVKDGVQDHSLSYDAEVSCDLNLKISLQEQRDENANEAKEKDSDSLSPEHHTDNINGSEKQDSHANDLTNIVEMREIKSNNKVEILNSEECFTFNSFWGEKGKPTETASSESEAVEQKHAPNDQRSLEHLVSTFPEIEGSSVCVASNSTKQVVGTTVLTVSRSPGDHQKDQLKETCSSESSDLGLVKHSISECEIDTDKDKLQEFYQLVNENSALKTGLGSEIEVDLEECDNASVFQQNIHSQGDDLCEEFELYETLKSRIDWEGLFGSSYEEMETSSFARREGTVQHHSAECNCVSFCSQDKELHNPIFLPDLQVTITNLLSLRISPTDESLDLKDVYKQATESTEPETNKGGNASGFGMCFQPSGENSSFSCENKFGNTVRESGDGSKPGSSHSSNSGQNTHVDQGSGEQNGDSLSTEPSNVTVMNDKSKCSTKSKPDFNDTRNKKDMQSRSSKRNLHASSRGHNIAQKDLRERETHKKRRKPTSHDSSDCFSSLSQGRIKTFSQSEKHIRNVLNILNSEASLCKSKHLSRKLNKAVLHLKKAHRRVHTSLQLISKVGQKRKGPLPKAYAIIRNNFWESCDLQGDSLMSERRYSKHFLSTRKYDKQGDKRFLRFDIEESLTPVSKHRSYRTNRERIAECLSSEVMSGHVSSSLTTFHLREFCDEEQLPESQFPVAYTSQSISQLEYTNSIVGNASSSELEHFSETSGNTLDPKETLIEKEYQTNIQLCNSDSAKLENHSSIRDIAKEYNSEEKRVVCESNPVSLSFIKENTSHSPDKSYDTTCRADTDKHISILDSNQKHILSVDIYEQDNCISAGAKNGEAIFPIENFTVSKEATSSISTENTASRSYCIPPVSTVPVTAEEEESSVGENRLLDINENEMNITKHSKLDLTSVTEESKICKKNMKTLSCNDSSMLLKENVNGPSKRYMAKYIEEEKIRKIEQAVYKKIINEGSAISFKYKSQNKILKEESFHVNKKITTNNLTDSPLSITNSTVDTIALKDIPNQLKERKEAGQIKVSNNSDSDCFSKPAIEETNHRPVLHGNPKVSALQKELNEHRSANYISHVTELSEILQRADETASLQILEEETKLCQNILPLFVEAFERQQDCSVNQILISRKLLVEQNLWNNCRLKLKPCAVDAWVELQMAMETIQFIENKKRFLEGKPTFRSLLWYDESLYSELLHRPRGYQLQSNFYPGFQGRLKYNAFCELQNYHNQLVESLTETEKENNSYYAFLKYKRQINECEAIMKHYTDCFDFCLSVPFACGVNFGDSLGDLETLRKSTLKLITEHGGSPKVHSYPGKKDHLWIIIEIVSSKVSFIKSSEEISIKICLYGLEHIYFDAAKSLVWKEKSCSLPKRHSEKNREMEEINESAFSKLKKIYGVLSKGLNNEPTSIRLENTMIVSKQSDPGSIPNCRLNKAWLSYPDISCVGEILDQAKSADLEKLQDLTLRCTDHLEILKKYFQMLQEDNIDNIFIMEENVLDMLNNYNPGAVILKPEAIEIYIEIVMISETIHYLKNLIAKKLHNPRFRGMLWFDWSLLPELIGCQEEVVSFSVGDTQTHCLWKLIETTISVLKKELAVIYEYGEASNCSYALHLFYRELKELTGVKRLLNNSKYSFSTYIDLVPHTASVNFGNTVAELEHNYKQFFLLLKNVMSVPQKDFGKMVHIIKVMKTIEHMKVLSAKDTKLSTHLLFLQMLRNKRNALQQNRQEKMETSVTEPEEDRSQPGVSEQTPPGAECIVKNISGFSKKRPVTADTCEVSQRKGNTDTVSSWKKQKVIMKDIGNRQAISKHASTTGSPPNDENKLGSNSSDSLNSISASPEVVKRQSSVPGSVSPAAESVQDTCTPESESKAEPTGSSPGTSASLTEQPEHSDDREKRNGNFSTAKTNNKENCPLITCYQKDIDASYSPDHTPAQKSHKISVDHTQISPSNLTAGNDDPLVPDASLLSVSASQSVKDVHCSLEMSGTDFHHENNEMLDLSTQDCTCTSSPEPVCIQNKIPVLQVDKVQPIKSESPEKCMMNASNPNTAPFDSYGNSALDVNGTVQHTSTEQNPKVLTQKVGTSRNKPPRSACSTVYNSSAHSFGTSYPYYSWCFYQYSSSNGTAVTHTYQGMTAYEIQQPPPPVLTTVASTVQSTHFNRSYSQQFSYFAGQPQANSFIPGNGYFPSHTPVSYNYQQPIYSQFASHHPVPQTAYPYPPNPGVLPQVPWTYAPWQQNLFPRRH